ncbi:MAG: MFS transporter [candidate division Zixibacteria bacterium]|nr:MFS transporter [candidate division Zixibacteria bacterium]
MTRNIKVFLVCEAALAAFGGFILPIYVLYFRYFGINLLQIAMLAAVFEATVLVTEIPTGLFADKFGRKLSVNIGFLLFAISGLIFIKYPSFYGFLIGEVFFGMAEAFISGASEALAVDSIVVENKDSALKRMFTSRSRVRIVMTALFMIGAGWVFAGYAEFAFYPVLVGGILGFIGSLFFIRNQSKESDKISLLEPVRQMFRQVKLIPLLKIIFWTSLVANFAFEGADQYWQVLSSEMFDIDVSFFGIITAVGAVFAFVLVGPLVKRFSGNISLPLLIILLAGITISSMPNITGILLPALLVIYFVCKELIVPLFSTAINSVISSEGRATFLSGYNLTCSVGEVASAIAAGYIVTYLGLPVVFVLCGGVLVLFTLVMLVLSQLRPG